MQGSGLAFVVYPEAIALLPGAPVFAVLFFLMLLCLGVDSQFAMVETVLTTVNDAKLLPGWSLERVSALVCFVMGVMGLIFVTRGGIHWLELFDSFAANVSLFIVGAFECIAVGWVYNSERLAAEVLQMTRFRLPKAVLWHCKVVIPACLLLLLIQSVRSALSNAHDLPGWGVAFGWVLATYSCLPIPYFAVRTLWGKKLAVPKLNNVRKLGPKLTNARKLVLGWRRAEPIINNANVAVPPACT